MKDGVNSNLFIEKSGLRQKKGKKIKQDLVAGTLSSSEAEELKKDGDVRFVEKIGIARIASVGSIKPEQIKTDGQTTPWGIRAIGADIAEDASKRGKGVRVAVLDTGIIDHPDLNIAGGISFVGDQVSDVYVDDNGHGTQVAGTIAAVDNKTGIVGVSDGTELYSVKVLDKNGTGSYADVIEGIEWAIQNKINVISMSFGGLEPSQALKETIQKASNQGIILVAAAGNNGPGEETELYPARYSEVISVGAVKKDNTRAPFSSMGKEIDIVAPGTDILSTNIDNDYGIMSGTSMAVPHITGAIAAVWSTRKEMNSSEVVELIYETATPIGAQPEYGNGLVNLAKALGVVNGPIDPVETVPVPVTGIKSTTRHRNL